MVKGLAEVRCSSGGNVGIGCGSSQQAGSHADAETGVPDEAPHASFIAEEDNESFGAAVWARTMPAQWIRRALASRAWPRPVAQRSLLMWVAADATAAAAVAAAAAALAPRTQVAGALRLQVLLVMLLTIWL
jgi:hypothetical protein